MSKNNLCDVFNKTMTGDSKITMHGYSNIDKELNLSFDFSDFVHCLLHQPRWVYWSAAHYNFSAGIESFLLELKEGRDHD